MDNNDISNNNNFNGLYGFLSFTPRLLWFLLIIANFIFGIVGIVMCSFRLYVSQEEIQESFFKTAILFATCNFVLSVLLLVLVIKKNEKHALLSAFLSFASLFFSIIYIETSTTTNLTFLIIFLIIGILFLFWFCIFISFQVLYRNEIKNENEMTEV